MRLRHTYRDARRLCWRVLARGCRITGEALLRLGHRCAGRMVRRAGE